MISKSEELKKFEEALNSGLIGNTVAYIAGKLNGVDTPNDTFI